MRKLYELTGERLQGCPPLVKQLPLNEAFSFATQAFGIGGKLLSLKAVAKWDELTSGQFESFEDMEKVFGTVFPKPSNLRRWKDDKLFGMQRLMGVNPDVIHLCTKIPSKLPVNNEMLKPFLEMSLEDALTKNRIFIIDYEIMDGLPIKSGFTMTSPIALFYQQNDGTLKPIAIQLFQKPGVDNPVFLPSDPEYTWVLAKMWFNVADDQLSTNPGKIKAWRLDVDGTLPNDIKERGLDGSSCLPDFYYRDDAMEIYNAILKYVQKYINLYYASDKEVLNDEELQQWRKEMVAPVDEQGLGMLVYLEKMTNLLRKNQYEEYAFPPNFDNLTGIPPKTKDKLKEENLNATSSTKSNNVRHTLVITDTLSTDNTHALGNFEVQYITDVKALKILDEFKADLAKIAQVNKEKNNKDRKIEKYWALNPKRVPNSIAI
ncbi:arachidonate 12-lipoxygenase, 12R-type-like [Ruditapes philippinarum]|uniref:arachidonate 12-lipoxygenase, 12R-type-like n=1 Tax=Ruditapes philippinarum TaxID=129788 RepID=UPI00295BD19E|nr:arachidonate 12-lipoxygenase, 12R-type-like [Ruditapes philippinarum]